jgi:hypothetical protein
LPVVYYYLKYSGQCFSKDMTILEPIKACI